MRQHSPSPADTDILTNITPVGVEASVNTADDVILGTWVVDYQGYANEHITFNANKTFEHFISPAGVIIDGGKDCRAGTETGTYVWYRATGLMMTRILTDENGDCGMSYEYGGVPYRFFVDGNKMKVLERAGMYHNTDTSLTRQ
jgi:hypothetical protein